MEFAGPVFRSDDRREGLRAFAREARLPSGPVADADRTHPSLRLVGRPGALIVTGGASGVSGSRMATYTGRKWRSGRHRRGFDDHKAAETVRVLNDEFGSGTASTHVGDLVAPGACDALVSDTIERCGGLDVVVNNAGYAWDGGVHSLSDEQIQAMLDIHLVVPFRIARACAPHFRWLPPRSMMSWVAAGTERPSWCLQWQAAGVLVGAANYAAAKSGMPRSHAYPGRGMGFDPRQCQCGRLRGHPNEIRSPPVRP